MAARESYILYSEHFENGEDLFKQACELGLEGIVSKKSNSAYKPSKSSWLKVKCQMTDELYIIGIVPSGKHHISALRLGKLSGKAFDYVGKVGTGFTSAVSAQLRTQLDQMVISKPTLARPLRKLDTKWVKPDLTAKIVFRGITGDGKLRHPSFKGLVNSPLAL